MSVDFISDVLSAFTKHMKATYGDTLEITSEYFWSVPDGQKYDNYDEPTLTIGQVSEVYAEIV
ncbi:hypothetical protein, partial [Nocardia acididurans]|uniref:hypothetical protein n=1 Tax=Nocardia acididurans TaxID=2802282 RepID=UPI001E2BA5B6